MDPIAYVENRVVETPKGAAAGREFYVRLRHTQAAIGPFAEREAHETATAICREHTAACAAESAAVVRSC